MVRPIKAGLVFTALAGVFLLQPLLRAQDAMKLDSMKQDGMKHDKMQDDKMMHDYCERFHAIFGVAKLEKF